MQIVILAVMIVFIRFQIQMRTLLEVYLKHMCYFVTKNLHLFGILILSIRLNLKIIDELIW